MKYLKLLYVYLRFKWAARKFGTVAFHTDLDVNTASPTDLIQYYKSGYEVMQVLNRPTRKTTNIKKFLQ